MRKNRLLAIIVLILGVTVKLPAQEINIGDYNQIKPIINAFYSGKQYDIKLVDAKEILNDKLESDKGEIFYFEVYEATKISMQFSKLKYENNVPHPFHPYTIINISILNYNVNSPYSIHVCSQRIATGSLSSYSQNDSINLLPGIYGIKLFATQTNIVLDPDLDRPAIKRSSSISLPSDFIPEPLPYRQYSLWANLCIQGITPSEEKYPNIPQPDISSLYSLSAFPDKNMVCIYKSHNGSNSVGSLSINYYDDLGRFEQTVNSKLTPQMKDLVIWQEYDLWGRKGNSWLPVATTQNDGTYVQGDLYKDQALSTYGGDTHAYTSYTYEPSPLEKIIEQCGPGNTWHTHKKTIKTTELTNVAGNDTLDCFSFQFEDGEMEALSIVTGKKYYNGSLFVTRIQDEDGKTSFEFKDNLGRIVLLRQVETISGSKQMLDTYYIYDDLGQLRAVLPPALSEYLSVGAVAPGLLEQYAYLYKYDKAGNQSAKKLPGIGWEYYVYDKSNKMIFSQNSVEREKGECEFYISDALGRVCLQGVCKNQINPFTGMMLNNNITCTYLGMTDYAGYTLNQTGLMRMFLDNPTIRTVNYYDNYNFMNYDNFQSSTEFGYIPQTGFCEKQANSKGLLTGALTMRLNESDESSMTNYKRTVIYYDERSRIVQTVSDNHLKGTDHDYFNYNHTGNIISHLHEHASSDNPFLKESYTYTYDSAERLTQVAHKLNNEPEVLVSANEYDELGRLQAKSLHNKYLNTTYEYNVRSWLSKIKSPLFNQTMHYTDGTGIPCYNGNISSMTWATDSSRLRSYRFSYDGLSRLKEAVYGEGNTLRESPNSFNEQVTGYDKNGNILGLKRAGRISEFDCGLIDNLSMSYNGNQLVAVNDNAISDAYAGGFDFKDGDHQPKEYFYDSNGNLIKDLNKKITSIQYNFLNLPNCIEFEDGSYVSYLYDAEGTKLRTVHSNAGNTTTTDYCGNVIYENGVPKMLLTEAGFISLNDNRYHYFLQDHQGNNRIVTDQNGNVEEVNHYYPFGGIFDSSSSIQPYKYNGKELDRKAGLDWYDYGARMYDAATGRWNAMDPMSEKYYGVSPYVYCANNPINIIDPDGRDWYWDKDKTRQFDPNITKDSQLKKGQTYIGVTDVVKDGKGNIIENYRNDGSIMFSNEASGYKRMVSNSLKTGNEEMGVITDKGVLVVPDYKNTSHGVNLADYGYKAEGGNIFDAKGTEFKTVATAHTHPNGSEPSDYDGFSWGDLGFAANATPNKPVFVFQLNGKNTISVIQSASSGGKMSLGFNQFTKQGITAGMPNINLKTIQNGNESLRRFTKNYSNYLRAFYNK